MGFVLHSRLVLQLVRTAGFRATTCENIVHSFITMDPSVKRTRRSAYKCKPDGVQTQPNLERPLSDKMDIHQPESIDGEMQLNDKEILLGRWKEGQELICAETQQATADSLENRFFKVRQSLLRETAGIDEDFNEQTMKSLQRIISGQGLLRKEAAISAKHEGNLDQQTHFQMDHNTLHLPFDYFIRSNSTRSVKCSSNPSKVILKDSSKCREKSRIEKSLSFKGKHLDFFEVVKEQLQQKDLENQHLVRLLMMKQRELKDTMEISKQKEKETQLIAEKLKCEEQKNTEITKKFDRTCEDMREELSEAKSNIKSSAKQLKALLDKYERLKTRANAVKDQLKVELDEKKSSQKTLKRLKQLTQELINKQKHLEDERDATAKDLSLCRETLQMMDAEHKKNISIKQRLEEELTATRIESENLKDHLFKTQEKNKGLIQLARSKESDKEKSLKESQDMIEKLNAELKKCQMEAHQQVEAMKNESQQIHNKQKVEILHLQEQQKACLQQSDALRGECETYMGMVKKLKMEKQVITEKLESIHKEKIVMEMASTKEGERLKEAIRLLERERKVLLEEMEDLRNDYLGISDRIAQKMGYVDKADPPMTITDITSNHHRRAQKKLSPTDDVIEDIRRKLEGENNHQS
ncbi:uncharacterized protein cccdc110 [Misgurnus anguillicaudatus]|uniref:uncharacterized protein cccdc110 n=1 Tax=Misgurnus anguillicaudatus TaxID=75329 RepID=UPI003CCF56C2